MAMWIIASMGTQAKACGLNWSEPKSHFEGVSFQGYVFLVEPLGQIELRDGRKLPVRAIFRSESNATSPFLGHGWELPILESHIVQMDERWFRVVEPTGWYRLFWRDEKDPTILHGQGNWKGVIRGNSISVMADCGDRLDFRDGRITSLHLKGHKLDVLRSLDGTASLKEGASTLLEGQKTLSRDGIALKIGSGETVEISYADRPVIEVIGGQPVVRQQVKSLGSLANGETARTWEYAVDEKLNPTMTIGDRKIAWSPTSRHVLLDGEWVYDIKWGETPNENAEIGRTDGEKKELWYHSSAKGEERVLRKDGLLTVRKWFVGGCLNGKTRSIQSLAHGKSIRTTKFSYNENGELLRSLLITDNLQQESDIRTTKVVLATNKVSVYKSNKLSYSLVSSDKGWRLNK